MLPEDRLDALLSPRRAMPQLPTGMSDQDMPLAPLLAAAAQLAVLADARPSATFAQALEERFLARAAALADAGTATRIGYTAQTLPGSDFPTLPSSYTAVGSRADSPTRQRATPQQRGLALLRSRYPRLLPQAIAASLVLMLGVGALTAAAAAGPGSFLFPLHRLEQGIQLGLTGSPADRFRLHLGYANDALAALDATHGDSAQSKSAYAQALTTLSNEERAAEQELTAVPAGTEHDELSAQLQTFKTRATHDLYAALGPSAALSWQNRLATTQTLGQLGAQVPHIDAVHISRVDDTTRTGDSGSGTGDSGSGSSGSRDTHSWKVTISGSGFTPGVVIMINGHPAGTVTQLSSTQIVALVRTDDADMAAGAIGIEASDGSATQANNRSLDDNGTSGMPNATVTPTAHSSDDHSGDTRGGKGSGVGGTPTPATSTPTPNP